MKKFFLLILLFCFPIFGWGQNTTITATVVDSDGTVWANAPYTLSFRVNPSQPNQNVYNINGVLLNPALLQYSGYTNGSGVLSQAVYQNTAISPSGSQWILQICPLSSAPACGSANVSTSGSTMNISTSINTAITAPRFPALAGAYGYSDSEAQITIPVGATYWNVTSQGQRYWNGSTWVSGNLPAGVSCTGSGTSQICTFPGTIAAGAVNNVYHVERFSGATADVQLANCLSSLASVGGGICDATGYGATTQHIHAMVQLGGLTSAVTYIFSLATTFVPDSCGMTMFEELPNTLAINPTINTQINCGASWTGKVWWIPYTSGSTSVLTQLDDFNFIGALSTDTTVGGTGLALQPPNLNYAEVSFASINHGHIYGYTDPVLLDASVTTTYTPFVNANSLTDITVVNGYNCLRMNTGTGSNPNVQVSGNLIGINCEAGPASLVPAYGSRHSIVLQGGTSVTNGPSNNNFFSAQIWDYSAAGSADDSLVTNIYSRNNYFLGMISDVSTQDLSASNYVQSNDFTHNEVFLQPHVYKTPGGVSWITAGGTTLLNSSGLLTLPGGLTLPSGAGLNFMSGSNMTGTIYANFNFTGSPRAPTQVNTDSSTNLATTAFVRSVVLVQSLITTSATSDNLTIMGMTASGHCLLTPTNAAASTAVGTYVSAKTTNQITISHAVTAAMNFDAVCTPY